MVDTSSAFEKRNPYAKKACCVELYVRILFNVAVPDVGIVSSFLQELLKRAKTNNMEQALFIAGVKITDFEEWYYAKRQSKSEPFYPYP